MKTLSPAELAKLEHSFAADPSSDAYKPLAEASLGMGRFMEAMVVKRLDRRTYAVLQPLKELDDAGIHGGSRHFACSDRIYAAMRPLPAHLIQRLLVRLP